LGLPSISTDCMSGPRDISDDGAVVKLVPPDDDAALSAGLNDFLADGELRRRLSVTGAESARRRFNLESVLEHWDALFQELEILRASPHRMKQPSNP
jgi:GalNAc-alpha-(1->4)-GalNAc-alpha-(1->3)-diNAcBac-PP-undecaprenol alpha-1,4-N-acetyl-D-galactosaminyltransferase